MLPLFFVFSGCESDTSSSNQVPCGDPSLRVSGISFTLNGIRYNDSISYGSSMLHTRGFSKVSLKYFWSGPGPDTIRNFYLNLSWPHYRSGIYPWDDRSSDSSAYGCTIYIDGTPSSNTYNSVSGSTNVLLIPGSERDSIFGTFCGRMKNDRGEVMEVTDGRFDAYPRTN